MRTAGLTSQTSSKRLWRPMPRIPCIHRQVLSHSRVNIHPADALEPYIQRAKYDTGIILTLPDGAIVKLQTHLLSVVGQFKPANLSTMFWLGTYFKLLRLACCSHQSEAVAAVFFVVSRAPTHSRRKATRTRAKSSCRRMSTTPCIHPQERMVSL